MFNPQRKSKPADIFMQQKALKLHLDKVDSIRRSPPQNEWTNCQSQQKYLKRLHHSKQEVKSRLSNNLLQQNQRLFKKLTEAERRPQEYSNAQLSQVNLNAQCSQKHFNSYFNHKKQSERIKGDNFGMIDRLINQSSIIPTVQQMKKEFKQSKRYEKMVRKLPAILRLQDTARKELSPEKGKTSRYESKVSLRSSKTGKGERASTDRTVSQGIKEIKHIEQALICKQ